MTYTLIIGTKEWSSWSLRPYVALRAIGVPFEEIVVQLRREALTGDEIRRYSPAGRVPILKIDDGGRTYSVWDSLAICETLAERHPEARLLPADPVTRAMARSYCAEMHSGFPDVRDQLSMDFVRRHPLPELRDATKAQIARILTAWELALEHHAKDGGFLFGGFLSCRLHVCAGGIALRDFRRGGFVAGAKLYGPGNGAAGNARLGARCTA